MTVPVAFRRWEERVPHHIHLQPTRHPLLALPPKARGVLAPLPRGLGLPLEQGRQLGLDRMPRHLRQVHLLWQLELQLQAEALVLSRVLLPVARATFPCLVCAAVLF
jgi:hypothetical protein